MFCKLRLFRPRPSSDNPRARAEDSVGRIGDEGKSVSKGEGRREELLVRER